MSTECHIIESPHISGGFCQCTKPKLTSFSFKKARKVFQKPILSSQSLLIYTTTSIISKTGQIVFWAIAPLICNTFNKGRRIKWRVTFLYMLCSERLYWLLTLQMPQIVFCFSWYIRQTSPAASLACLSLVARLRGLTQIPAQGWPLTPQSKTSGFQPGSINRLHNTPTTSSAIVSAKVCEPTEQ